MRVRFSLHSILISIYILTVFLHKSKGNIEYQDQISKNNIQNHIHRNLNINKPEGDRSDNKDTTLDNMNELELKLKTYMETETNNNANNDCLQVRHYNGKLTYLLNLIAPNRIRCIFSDLDGTLLHPGSKLIEDGYEILNLEEGESVSFSSSSSSRQSDPSNFPLYPLTRLTESSIKSSTAISNKRLQPNIRLLRTRDSKNNLVERIALELPSLSAGPGYISIRTLELLHDLRSKYGCMLILITGARSSTYIYRRCVGLPVADYEIVEGGGRLIHDPISDNSKVFEILETYQKYLFLVNQMHFLLIHTIKQYLK